MPQVSSRDFKDDELADIRAAFANQGQPATDADLEAHVTKFLVDRTNGKLEADAIETARAGAKKIPASGDAALGGEEAAEK